MSSDDFIKIFYSHFPVGIDWQNIDEIAWMYQQGLLEVSQQIVGNHEKFEKTLNLMVNPANHPSIKTGESLEHLALKVLATDYLTSQFKVLKPTIKYELTLSGFEVDVIDDQLRFPTECGDTNPLKLETYLALPSTEKFLIFPYPKLTDLKVFQFSAEPRFFEYLDHKNKFLNKQRSKWR